MRDIKNDVVENKHGILHNKQSIQQNKDAIQEIRQGCSNRCITQDILMRITGNHAAHDYSPVHYYRSLDYLKRNMDCLVEHKGRHYDNYK